ncbi:MAG: hypothetical protein JWN04_6014 [Myxococcaceae bacterium]|nr:hypothetical protein [Myxococcaceae bacterium]
MKTRLSPFYRQPALAAAALALITVSCGDDTASPATYAGGSDAGTHADAATSLDAAISIDAATHDATTGDSGNAAIPTINGCAAADYLDKSGPNDSRIIEIASMGLTYTPRCIIVAKGQTVTWTGSLNAHPLAAGNAAHPDAGTLPSPIVEKSSGNSVAYAFPNAGVYPYYCTNHGYGAGDGMSGSIYVK